MSESAARQRAAINLDEFERRLRVPDRPAREEDPLAELARLVGASDDPFKDIFAADAATAFAVPPQDQASVPSSQGFHGGAGDQMEHYVQDAPAILRNVAGQMRHGEYAPAPYQQQFAPAAPQIDPQYDSRFHHPVNAQPAPAMQFSTGLSRAGVPAPQSMPRQGDPQPYAQIRDIQNRDTHEQDPQEYYEPAMAASPQMQSPQVVAPPAQYAAMPHAAMPHAAMPPFIAAQNVPPPPPRQRAGVGSRKNMMLMGGALGVLVLGIGATLATKGSMRSAGKSAPTILASKEPVKIKPEAGTPAGVAEGANPRAVRNISLLERGAEKPQQSRVVSREEQPVDLRQVPPAPRATNRASDPDIDRKVNLADRNATRPLASVGGQTQAPSGNGYFPEPRKVRTVMVRPDGTIIAPPAPAPRMAAPARPSIAMMATGSTAEPAAPAVRAPEPRQRAAVPAPQPPARPAQRATNRAAQTAPAPSREAAPRPQRTAAVNLQGAARPAAATSASGGFAVQLAAPGSETEARGVVTRLRQRYAGELGGRSPSIVKANVGTRTVYRVRVTGMSREAATAMCSKLQGKGGACFVARN